MAEMTISVPITLEQIADAIRQLGSRERNNLLTLLLKQEAKFTISPTQQAVIDDSLAGLKQEVRSALNGKRITNDSRIYNGMTLERYLALSDKEQQNLWDEWSGEQAWLNGLGI